MCSKVLCFPSYQNGTIVRVKDYFEVYTVALGRSASHPASAPSPVLYAIILGRKLAENLAYLFFLTGALA